MLRFTTTAGLFLILSAGMCHADDVPWLTEVTTPSGISLPSVPSAFLKKADGTPITTLEEWKPVREQIRAQWLDFLGPLPSAKEPLTVKAEKTEDLAKCTRTLIRYEAEPGRMVRAYLLKPKGVTASGRFPGLVVFHSTTRETIDAVAGKGSKPEQGIGLQLAERGFVVVCPANYLWEQSSYGEAAAATKKRHPESLGMTTMLADGMRAVDVLLQQTEVDPHRVGTIGHSLGAKEALYLMAFDDRVLAGVSSEGGMSLHSSNWEAEWYLGRQILNPGFARTHAELAALIAPRPFLVLGGEAGSGCADGERSWPPLKVGQQVTAFYGQPVRMGLLNHHQGHQLTPESAEKAFEFLEYALRSDPQVSPQ
ncbi:alpha/beta hydrolase family protein [Planctomicrobium piriforme]|uniref:Dienelactone hydrolase family protein n=1 Tax=Planctomicrobium piriforme TaxID=1576369 RepID=A0A1I3QBQ6_9PLAN|nr:dienelactone hydrolase family protein [Planctomicrobium piriforme]SFJ30566.1 Dienelactone hydrolase family protein [Planctomicrobium piriforme]